MKFSSVLDLEAGQYALIYTEQIVQIREGKSENPLGIRYFEVRMSNGDVVVVNKDRLDKLIEDINS